MSMHWGMPDEHLATDDVVIFEGADAASTVKVPKVEVATDTRVTRPTTPTG